MTTPTTQTIALSNGKSAQPIHAGKPNIFKAHATEHYRIIKGESGNEQLLDDVIAQRVGDNLQLQYADGAQVTKVTLENYYTECKTASACEITLPGKDPSGYIINAKGAAVLADGADEPILVYAHGNHDVLMGMTKGDDTLYATLVDIKGTETTYIAPSAAGAHGKFFGDLGNIGLLSILGGGFAVGALLGGGSGGGTVVNVAHNMVSGTIVAGPTVAGNDLEVYLYAADGATVLGRGIVSATGTFSIDVGNYSGVVIAKLQNLGTGIDYRDEATGQTHNLSANLMAIGVASGSTVTLNINALTTVAATKAGALYNSGSNPAITADAANNSNAAVASAFGLTDLTGTAVITTINADGTANTNYSPGSPNAGVNYGAILAALSGVDAANSGSMQTTIDNLANGLAVSGSTGTLSNAELNIIITAANVVSATTAGAGATSLTSMLSNLTAQTSHSVSIDAIATDGIVNGSEQAMAITGTNATGATVNLNIGGTVRAATVTGTTWSYSLVGGDITHMGQGSETISATASLSGGGTASATRSIWVDTVAPTIVIGTDDYALKMGDVAHLTFTLSETATNFVAADVSVAGGALSNFSGSGTSYTADFTPTAGTASGNASITVASGAYTDAAGNNGGAGTTPAISIDTLAPTLAISSNVSAVKIGETAVITFTFSEDPGINFVGSNITTSGGTLGALSGSGLTRSAIFTPTDGTASGNASITVAAGAYSDAAGNTGGAGTTPAISIDTIAPTLAISSNMSALKVGETAAITFTFSEDPGASFVAGDIVTSGGTLGTISGSGLTRTATFTPTAGQNSGTASITVTSGAYTDAAGNIGGAGTTPSISFDTLAPAVSNVAITSYTGVLNGASLDTGNVVHVTVTMDDATTVTGIPQLALNIGGTTVYADYVSGSSSTALIFNYTIQLGQNDGNGISIDANSLRLNGGTLKDPAGNSATLTHSSVVDNGSYMVSAVAPDTTGPFVNSISITSATGIQNSALNAGDVVHVAVNLSEATLVTGIPQLALNIGGTPVQASYVSGSGSATLVFDYTIQAGQNDVNGISIDANSLALNGGTLKDAANNVATLTHGSVADNGSYLVDTTAPIVNGIAITSATGIQNSTLNAGDVIHVTVNMSDVTTVTGTPQLALNIGGTTVQASYASGSGSAALVFDYTVQAGQNDLNGISIAANSLALVGGTLVDAAGNAATLTHGSVVDNGSYLVDTTAPTLAITSNVSAVKAGDTANITFTFSEDPGSTFVWDGTTGDVTVVGGTLGAISGSGLTRTATFTPTAGTASGNASITVASEAYTDAAGNNGGAGTTPAISIDTLVPTANFGSVTDNVGSIQGALTSGATTDDTSLALAGSCESGSTVNVYDGLTLLGAATVSGTSWSYAATVADGITYQFNVKEIDTTGNQSTATSDFTVTGDTTAPTLTVAGVDISADSGVSATDFITNIATQTITGTLSGALATGDILYGSVDNGASWVDITSKVTGTAISWDSATLNGSSAILFQIADAAGNNSSTTGYRAYELDTTAPTAPISVTLTPVGGTVVADTINNSNTDLTVQATIVAGEATGGSAVLKIGGATILHDYSILAGDTTVDFDIGTTTNAQLWAAISTGGLVTVELTDAAGNVIASSVGNPTLAVVISGPTLTVGSVAISADSGSSTTDFITNIAVQTITGTLSGALAVGDILYGSVDNGTTWSVITSKVSGTAISWDGATLSGTSNILFKITDSGGRDSATTGSTAYELDVSPPIPNFGSATDSVGSVTGLINNGATTNDPHPVLAGTCEIGSTVNVYNGATLLGAATIGISGFDWSYTATVANGTTYQFKVRETDAAGNESAATTNFTVIGDTLAPTVTALTQSGRNLTITTGETGDTPIILDGSTDVSSNFNVSDNGDGTYTAEANPDTYTGSETPSLTVQAIDAAGNTGAIFATPVTGVIDSTPPIVSGIALTSATGTLNTNDVLQVTVTLSEATLVTGTPQLALNIGGTTVNANYISGSGTTALIFNYTILPGQTDADGISIDANSLALNGGTLKDAAGNNATLDYVLVVDNASYLVNAVAADTTVPVAPTVALTADSGSSSSDKITNSGSLTVSGVEAGATVEYSANGTTGWSVTAPTATEGSNTVYVRQTDAAGNVSSPSAAYTFTLDTGAPIVSGIAITSATGINAGTLEAGNVVHVTVTMSDVSDVSGTPKLALNIGGTTVYADYASGSGSTALVFDYTILPGQVDANGISIAANSLSITSRSNITDIAGNSATLTHAIVADNASYRVTDTTAPTISGVAITSADGIHHNTLNAGDVVTVTVNMSEATAVDITNGTPQLALNIGGTTVNADYAYGSGTTALSFNYTILSGQTDANGISIAANSLTLNGGTLKDTIGNDATLTHAPVADNASYKVIPGIDTTVVVFDLVHGVSSSHSGHTFDANVAYDIYVMVDSSSATLNTTPTNSATWNQWLGGNNLNADDRIILVGNGSPVQGGTGTPPLGVNASTFAVAWLAGGQQAARVDAYGAFTRNHAYDNAHADLWNGAWSSNPNIGRSVSNIHLSAMPAHILTSQGLV